MRTATIIGQYKFEKHAYSEEISHRFFEHSVDQFITCDRNEEFLLTSKLRTGHSSKKTPSFLNRTGHSSKKMPSSLYRTGHFSKKMPSSLYGTGHSSGKMPSSLYGTGHFSGKMTSSLCGIGRFSEKMPISFYGIQDIFPIKNTSKNISL
ncbi:MAG: hypothetical protein WCH34_08410 [Bacteroidota bacterium]